jgi:hypothetical protein
VGQSVYLAPVDPKLESGQRFAPPIIQGVIDYLPNLDREPLDVKWMLWILWHALKDSPLFVLMFVICWFVTGIAFTMFPHRIQEWLPG